MTTEARAGIAVKLLWTGGWDSTFRLLQLVLVHGKRVQPCYLIDAGRRSLGIEIRTMDRLKRHLIRGHPHARGLILPTRYAHVTDLKPDRVITEAYRAVHEATAVAPQSEWLALYCLENGIESIEQCAHRGSSVDRTIRSLVTLCNEGASPAHRMDDAHSARPEHRLFRSFRFPLFDIDKMQMMEIAREAGWMALLSRTWFCLRPRRRRTPCGHCVSCRLTIRQGMGWRIPWRNRVLGRLYLALRIKPIRRRAGRLLRAARLRLTSRSRS